MSGWTGNDLAGAADELEITSFRNDGTIRAYTIHLGCQRWRMTCTYGPGEDTPVDRSAMRYRRARVVSGPAGSNTMSPSKKPDVTVHPAIDDAYRTKYGRYPEAYVQPMVEPDATAATFRLVPRGG
jgi:hypothetical protein